MGCLANRPRRAVTVATINRRSERSHVLTHEDRSKGGLARARKIRQRQAEAEKLRIRMLAEGPRPRRRRPLKWWEDPTFTPPDPPPRHESSPEQAAKAEAARERAERYRGHEEWRRTGVAPN